MPPASGEWPIIRTAGVDGYLVSFADRLSEPANRAALALRAAVDNSEWSDLLETSTSLVSTYLRFDPLSISHEEFGNRLATLVQSQDWSMASLPTGRRLWRIPTSFEGPDDAPQLKEAADLTGLTTDAFIEQLSGTKVRVQTIGFAPGQPYLGELPEEFDIPRQSTLTKQVPAGALTVAIRQIVLFSNASPTGWRHVAQTALKLFQSAADDPFLLRPGDEALFVRTTPDALLALRDDPMGGATYEALP